MFQRYPDVGLTTVVLSNHYGCNLEAGTLSTLDDEAARIVHPEIAPPVRLAERADPQPALTHSLLLLLQGADEAHGAIRTTAAFRTLVLPGWRRRAPPTALRFVQCTATPATNPSALGSNVEQECVYHSVPDTGSLIFVLTPRKELAGITLW
jgi:hypothetical protein